VDVCRGKSLQVALHGCTEERHSGLLVLNASQGEHHPPEGANVSIQILKFSMFSLLQEWGYSRSTMGNMSISHTTPCLNAFVAGQVVAYKMF
jgi:hypothetical protein